MSKTDYDNELRGALFQNDKRREGKKDPHYKGSCEIGGEQYWIAGWKKKSKDGTLYVSLSYTKKEVREDDPKTLSDDDLSDTPF